MKHVHGIEIRLLDDKGRIITEAAPSKNNPFRFNAQVGSRNVHLKAGQRFKVCVTIHRNFKFYKAEGVKVVVVANGSYAGDRHKEVRQRHGLWYIREDERDRDREVMLEGFTVWNKRRPSREEFTGFLAPGVYKDSETTTSNWITEKYYCANEGCIAVFVERGSLVEEDEEAGITLGERSSMRSPIPIRFDEFLELRSDNANPYIFEFRNSNGGSRLCARGNDTFGGVPEDVDDDDDEIVYDTDCEMDSESEEEAEATDESDSESASGSDGDSDTDSLISVDSYDSIPGSGSRKRKARTPANKSQRKKAKTTAQTNAEADAGNATFASSRNKKNRDADATNPSLFDRGADSDRDDEELDLPYLKKEPGIKQERGASTVPQKSSPQAAASRKRGGGASFVDLTLSDSEDEDEDKVSNGIRSLRKKLDGMAKNVNSVKRGMGVKI